MWKNEELNGLQVVRGGADHGPWAVLIPGLVGDVDALDDLCRHLAPDHRLLSWAPRGLYGSAAPADDNYSPEGWLDDLHGLLVHYDIEQALLIGWSAGGRVAIEASTRWPDRIAGAVSIAGTWGRPFDELLQSILDPGSSLFALFSGVSAAIQSQSQSHSQSHSQSFSRLPPWAVDFARSRLLARLLRLFRISADTTEAGRLGELIAASLNNDLHGLLATWHGVSEHSRSPIVADLPRPTLWFAGDHDVLTRVDEARAAASGTLTTFVAVPGGTHFLPLDQPELIRLHLSRFTARLNRALEDDLTNPTASSPQP